MQLPADIPSYLQTHAAELGQRILESYPPACSKKAKKTVTVKRKPGASPLLFGKYVMDHCAFVGLEDISANLPSYREEVVPVAMDEALKTAYGQMEEEITACLKEHHGNHSVVSTMLNTLLGWLTTLMGSARFTGLSSIQRRSAASAL